MANQERLLAEKEERRLKPILEQSEGDKGPIVVVRPSFKPRTSAEEAWRAGETEEEMIAKKMKELQMKAKLKEKNKAEQAEERQQPDVNLHSPRSETKENASQSLPTTPVNTPVKVNPHSCSQPTTPVEDATKQQPTARVQNSGEANKEETRLKAHFLYS